MRKFNSSSYCPSEFPVFYPPLFPFSATVLPYISSTMSFDNSASPEPYYRIGHFIVKETLGVGGFGKVKVADDERTGYRYACKIIDKASVRSPSRLTQLQREINCMRRLRHRNVVYFKRVLSTSTKIYILMEYIAGGELSTEVRRFGRLTEPYARFYFKQLIDGLQHCHANGVFHRDLKPDNLLLGENGTLKISDFGLSFLKLEASNSSTASAVLLTQCGTLNYIAPEIVALGSGGDGYSGRCVDAWSCGVILYNLVSGYLPFQSKDPEETLQLILHATPEYPSFISESVVDLISKLLVSNPPQRYTLNDIRQHPWFNGPVEDHMQWEPPSPRQYDANASRDDNWGSSETRINLSESYSPDPANISHRTSPARLKEATVVGEQRGVNAFSMPCLSNPRVA